MDTERMIRELRRLADEHKNDRVDTFATNWSALCSDVANRLEELLEYKHMYVIEELAASVPEQTKANVNAKYNFDNDNKALIEAFTRIGVALRDENGDYRNLYDVLKDMGEKYEQIKD